MTETTTFENGDELFDFHNNLPQSIEQQTVAALLRLEDLLTAIAADIKRLADAQEPEEAPKATKATKAAPKK